MTFRIKHGKSPVDAKYSYVILPGKSASETKEYSMNPDIEIIENTTVAHAVYEIKLQNFSCHLYELNSYK